MNPHDVQQVIDILQSIHGDLDYIAGTLTVIAICIFIRSC